MSNLREGERLFVDVTSVHLDGNVVKSSALGVILDLQSGIEVLLIEGHTELIESLVHLVNHLILFSLLLLSLSIGFLLLGKFKSLSLLSLFLSELGLLSFLLLLLLLLFLFDSFLLGKLLFFGGLLLLSCLLFSGFFLSLFSNLLLSISLCLEMLRLKGLLLCFGIGLFLKKSCLFKFKSLLSFHLLLDLQHLELSFGLSSRELVLSLQPGKVGLGSGLLGSGGLGLLDGLGSKEFLLHSLSLQFLSSLFLLKLLKLSSSGVGKDLLLLSLLLGLSDLALELLILLDLSLSLLLLQLQLVEKSLLLCILLSLELLESPAFNS